MFHRSLSVLAALAAILACALAGCGGGGAVGTTTRASASPTTIGSDQAAIVITKRCGASVVLQKTGVPAETTAMQALQRVAKLKTSYGGKFVDAIDGVEPAAKNDSWLFYVNGRLSQKGATEVKLSAGDVEWWDLHNYKKSCQVPAVAQ